MSKSYVVRKRDDGTRYFSENTPTGISPASIGEGLAVDATGLVYVDNTKVAYLGLDQTFTGNKAFANSPEVPTPTAGDSSAKVASTEFVSGAIDAAVQPATNAPASVDTESSVGTSVKFAREDHVHAMITDYGLL